MISALRTFGRVLWGHWPALLAWYLGGQLIHKYWIEFAGWVGGSTAAGGMLLMPVALMAQLVSYVAMFLVVRDGLRNLRAVAPAVLTGAARRAEFLDAIFAAMVPFVAFYAAQGFLRKDMAFYASEAWEETSAQMWRDWGNGTTSDSAGFAWDGRGSDLGITPLSVGILIAAYLLRKLWVRYEGRVPKWLAPVGVYLEAVWIYLGATIIFDVLALANGWVQTRVGVIWLEAFGGWFAEHLAVVSVVWGVIVATIGQIVGVTAQPLAWLAVAGTIYGQTLSVEKIALRIRNKRVRLARARYGRLNAGLRRRIADFFAPVVGKFTPLWNAITLMFRAGPLLIAGYVFAYSLWLFGSEWFRIAGYHAFGPHDRNTFWAVWSPFIAIGLAAVTESIRIAITASAYDSALGLLHPVRRDDDGEAVLGEALLQGEAVGPHGIIGDEEGHEGLERGVPIHADGTARSDGAVDAPPEHDLR